MIETLAFRGLATLLAAMTALMWLPPLERPESGQYGPIGGAGAPTTTAPYRQGPDQHPTATTVPPMQATISGCQDALNLAVKVGWPLDQMGTLATVLWRESRCTNTMPDGRLVHNPGDPAGGSWCALQLNGAHFESTPWRPGGWMSSQGIGVNQPSDLANAELCLRAGLALYRFAARAYGDGWQPWNATRP